jgi:hypothetical protein
VQRGNESARPWSKYSKGSSAYEKKNGSDDAPIDNDTSDNENETKKRKKSSAENDAALKDFVTASTAKKRKAWENDLQLPSEKIEEEETNNVKKSKKGFLSMLF